jgi:hypothetical protein
MALVKLLSLIGIAVLAAASLATYASASEAEFHVFDASAYPAEFKTPAAAKNHVLTIENGLTVKCESATFAGSETYSELQREIKLLPTYSSCTAFGLAATVNMEGCGFKVNADTGALSIECPTGKVVKITAGTCEVQIGSQENLKTISYANSESSPATVSVEVHLTSVKYNKTKDGFLCPLAGTGELANGAYDGAFSLAAYDLFKTQVALQQKMISISYPAMTEVKKGGGESDLKIVNNGDVDWEIKISTADNGTGVFNSAEKCVDVAVKAGGSCTEKIKCSGLGTGNLRIKTIYMGAGGVLAPLECKA